jgi:hypothetical protein
MADYVAMRVIKLMIGRNIQPSGSRVLGLGSPSRRIAPTCVTRKSPMS